jgi:hypothetical protein
LFFVVVEDFYLCCVWGEEVDIAPHSSKRQRPPPPRSPLLFKKNTQVDITPGGAADRTGKVSMGDQLIATTGITYSKVEDYNGVMVRKGQEVVTLNVLNESFKTVSAAIGTHPASVPVRLTFQRCDDASAASAAASRD